MKKIIIIVFTLFSILNGNSQNKNKCTYNISHKIKPVYSNSTKITKAEVYIKVDCKKNSDVNVLIEIYNKKGKWQSQTTKTIKDGNGTITRKPSGLRIGDIAKYRYYFYPKSAKIDTKILKNKDYKVYEFEIIKILK